ncbi:HEAT repeat domain-containing protein [Halohasta litorea]|uniref:HEAT repeat domain-containing protein n=1 Tax=Halohasta litorea TaxID=869891 RepID=A0ABD6DBV5_9EURY|nr:HEAT repeat domain-containing protein [Halohasta litorea]
MSEPDQPSTPDRLTDLLTDGDHEETVACLNQLGAADAEARKRVLRASRDVAKERPRVFKELAAPLATFLTDDDRAVRLTTAKLFVTLAQSEPTVTLPVVDALAERLADDGEFYYVRARCAEALGYVAVDSPENVTDPETLADLRIGLRFDEPEVKEKLAKALAYVGLGDPGRLRYHVTDLAEHLNSEDELVRYYLATALVAVACEHADALEPAVDALSERIDDSNPYVRGRSAEALGLANRSGFDVQLPDDWDVDAVESEAAAAFLEPRVRFAAESGPLVDGIGETESIRNRTDDIVEAMTTPDGDDCPRCGLALPSDGMPMCPRCGRPF